MTCRPWIATAVATTFLSGCAPHATRANDARVAQVESRLDSVSTPTPQPAEPQPTAPPMALAGSREEGWHAGERDAERPTVAGYGALGFVIAPCVLLSVVVACGGGTHDSFGDMPFGSYGNVAPQDAAERTPEYLSGYEGGYNNRLEERRDRAFLIGLGAGVLVIVGALVYGSLDSKRREEAENPSGQHATVSGHRGATVFEF